MLNLLFLTDTDINKQRAIENIQHLKDHEKALIQLENEVRGSWMKPHPSLVLLGPAYIPL